MIYLIKNLYVNNGIYNYELIDTKLEKTSVRTANSIFEIGDFVIAEFENKKLVIKEKINRPENFLEYYEKSKYTTEELKLKLSTYIGQIKNPKYKIILDETINKNTDYYLYPAAKNIHHAFIGGLVEHTLNILYLSDSFIKLYDLDKELLYMGIMLHDYAKIIEMSHYGVNYSLEGNLLGHISMCVEEISFIARMNDFNDDINITALKHLILSHHGRMDYGSPKEPMILEAYVLSMLDEVDAKVDVIKKSTKTISKNKLSSPVNAFDRRRFMRIK